MNSEDLQSLMEAYSKVHESSEELNETQVFEDITPERARYDAMVAARDKAQGAKTIQGQSQTAKALSSGKGINVKGAGLGADLGRGYGATYKGREAIRVPGAGQRGYEPEINAAGKRFFANVQGKDVIYTSNYKAGQKNLGVAPTAKPKVDPAADAKAKSDAQREKYSRSAREATSKLSHPGK